MHHFQANFQKMARAWQACGASAVCLRQEGREIARFPMGVEATHASPLIGPHLTATLPQEGLELCIDNLEGEHWLALAEVQLLWIGNAITAESEAEQMTAALVETQDRLVAMFELTQAVRRQVGIAEVLDLLVGESRRLLDCHQACAVLLQPDQEAMIRQSGFHPLPEDELLQVAESFRAHPSQQMLKIDEQPFVLGNALWVALPVRESVIAVLGLYQEIGMQFNAPDIKLVRAISDQIGSQLENALLIQEALARTRLEAEMSVAREVQMALLPQVLPKMPGLDMYGTSVPAHQVGGDFFDVIREANQPMYFYVGDITGKGIPAALLMTMTRTVAHSLLRFYPRIGPAGLVSHMNRELTADFSNVGMFTTIFAGQYHPDMRRLVFTNGGQSPILFAPSLRRQPLRAPEAGDEGPALRRPDEGPAQGPARLLAAEDPPVGILEDHPYSEFMLELKVGDVLVVATDGFNETWNSAGEMYGYERLVLLLDQVRHRPAREIAGEFFRVVEEFSGANAQRDDRTLLVLKAVPMDGFSRVEIAASLAELELVTLALKELVARSVGDAIAATGLYACEQALHELLSNQVRHACKQDASQRIQVCLSVQADPLQVQIESEDQGLAFPPEREQTQLPDPGLLQEGGYGLPLIRALMDSVSYQRLENNNIWKMGKQFNHG